MAWISVNISLARYVHQNNAKKLKENETIDLSKCLLILLVERLVRLILKGSNTMLV